MKKALLVLVVLVTNFSNVGRSDVLFLRDRHSFGAGLTGSWQLSGSTHDYQLWQDDLGTFLVVRVTNTFLDVNGTLRRRNFDEYDGTLIQTANGCTVNFRTIYQFAGNDTITVRVRGSNGACGFSPNFKLDYTIHKLHNDG